MDENKFKLRLLNTLSIYHKDISLALPKKGIMKRITNDLVHEITCLVRELDDKDD